MSSTPEDKIITYLMNNMEDIQQYVSKHSDSVPDFVLYDVVVRRIEDDTGCNYLDIITYLNQRAFNNMFMFESSNVEN